MPSTSKPVAPSKKPSDQAEPEVLGEPPPYRNADPTTPISDLNLHQRLCVLQEWIGGMKKGGVYADGRTTYNFHAHDDVMDVIRVRLARLGIDTSTEIVDSTSSTIKGKVDQASGVQKEGVRTVVIVQVTLTNADRPEDERKYVVRMTGQGYDDKDHSKAGTLAQKYFWVWKLNLGNAEDADEEKSGDGEAEVAAPASAELPEGVESKQWESLAFLAKTVEWGPKKVKARIVHHGGQHDGYVKTLGELMDEHAAKHGPDCEHVRQIERESQAAGADNDLGLAPAFKVAFPAGGRVGPSDA